MTPVDPLEAAGRAMPRIQEGAFLTVRAGDALNTMTIGWASIGPIWRLPVMVVAVRPSRHTYALMERAADFTVSLPSGDMRRQVAFCGTRSGREVDKFAALDLGVAPATRTLSPVIAAAALHFECRTLLRLPMDPARLDAGVAAAHYSQGDWHTFYYGQILACYETR
jgi:flavin reductase (DIM6/NTAB) family NADH-FMN oxidoreductase RutF